jgi:hypothetical protein
MPSVGYTRSHLRIPETLCIASHPTNHCFRRVSPNTLNSNARRCSWQGLHGRLVVRKRQVSVCSQPISNVETAPSLVSIFAYSLVECPEVLSLSFDTEHAYARHAVLRIAYRWAHGTVPLDSYAANTI